MENTEALRVDGLPNGGDTGVRSPGSVYLLVFGASRRSELRAQLNYTRDPTLSGVYYMIGCVRYSRLNSNSLLLDIALNSSGGWVGACLYSLLPTAPAVSCRLAPGRPSA